MKFDCVIGNPPYQKPKNRNTDVVKGVCGSTLWDKFVTKGLKLKKDDGFLISINPGQWRKPESELMSVLKDSLLYLEIHSMADGLKTFGVQTGYDIMLVGNKTEVKTTLVDQTGITNNLNLSKMDFIPNFKIKEIMKMIAKNDEEKINLFHSFTAYETRKPHMSANKTKKFKYPCIYGITKRDGLKLWYSSCKKEHFGVKKVIMPVSKSTYAFYDKNGEYGLSQFAFGIEVKSDKEGYELERFLLSKKMNDIFEATEWIYNTKNFKVLKYFKKDFWKEFI